MSGVKWLHLIISPRGKELLASRINWWCDPFSSCQDGDQQSFHSSSLAGKMRVSRLAGVRDLRNGRLYSLAQHHGPKECVYVLWTQLLVNCTQRGTHSSLLYMWLWFLLLHFLKNDALLDCQPSQAPIPASHWTPIWHSHMYTVVQLYQNIKPFTFVSYIHLSLSKYPNFILHPRTQIRKTLVIAAETGFSIFYRLYCSPWEQFRVEFQNISY